MSSKDISIKISKKVKEFLAEAGFDQTFGARPLKRKIQELILDQLAMEIIDGKVKNGDDIAINLDAKQQIVFELAK